MTHPPFDAARAVQFDLAHGHVHLEGAPGRVLVPADALAAICEAGGAEATAALGRAMGEVMGRRLAARLGAGGDAVDRERAVREASMEAVVDHLGGEVALAGLGLLSIERWGRALVLVVDHSPLGARGAPLLEAVLEAAVSAASGRRVRCAALGHDGGRTRYLVGGSTAADKVRAWLAEGVSWGDVVVRLHAQTASPSEIPRGAS